MTTRPDFTLERMAAGGTVMPFARYDCGRSDLKSSDTPTIRAWTVWRIRKAAWRASPALFVGSVLLTLDVLGFAIFSGSLDRADREKWSKYFPEGTHALALMFFTFVIAIICLVDCYRGRPKGK